MDRPRGFTLIEMLLVVIVVAIIAAIVIPGLAASRRASGERGSSASIKTLSSAEYDFRANDRDWNRVNDFWTGDVKSLYTLTSAEVPGARGGTTDPSIKLIELSLAASDADGTTPAAGGENVPLTSYIVSMPKAGYWYAAMTADLTSPLMAESTYRLDTGGSLRMGSCHHLSKFGFVGFPDSQSAGVYVYIINENNTIFRSPTSGAVNRQVPGPQRTVPPGFGNIDPAYLNWPDAKTLQSFWSKLD